MEVRRASLIYFLIATFKWTIAQSNYEVPEVTTQALRPRGFRASIPDAPGLGLFVFQGNVNRAIGNKDVGTLAGEVIESTDGKWVFQDPNIELKVGDTINYYVFVSVNKVGYLKDNLQFKVTVLEDESIPIKGGPPANCKPTITTLRSGTACAGQVIFEDHFNSLKKDAWQIEQYIPVEHPEYPFVSYQHLLNDPTVSVEDGNLRIRAKLQQNQPGYSNESIYSGALNLESGCTGSGESCSMQAWGANILPPVVSGRITNKGFAFKYGTVYVRAKLPQGDWLYPEILLEPLINKYGKLQYASGVIKIASARGNKELSMRSIDYSNKVLYGGLIMDFTCKDVLQFSKARSDGQMWGDDFHEYAVVWTPEIITLSVDGEEWARVRPAVSGLRGRLPKACRDSSHTPPNSAKIAPFDDHFYLTLGLAAGGITDFKDGTYTGGGRPKPWVNYGRKASLNFWQDLDVWLPTWNQPELLVDYVKIVALG